MASVGFWLLASKLAWLDAGAMVLLGAFIGDRSRAVRNCRDSRCMGDTQHHDHFVSKLPALTWSAHG